VIVQRVQHYILHQLVRAKAVKLVDIRAKTKLLFSEERIYLDDKLFSEILLMLQEKKCLEVSYINTEEYEKCLEEARLNKRVRNPQRYCRQQYPSDIYIVGNGETAKCYIESFLDLCYQLRSIYIDVEQDVLLHPDACIEQAHQLEKQFNVKLSYVYKGRRWYVVHP